MADQQKPPDDADELEDQARRLHRGDASVGGVGFFRSWESLSETTREMYRAQVRAARRERQ